MRNTRATARDTAPGQAGPSDGGSVLRISRTAFYRFQFAAVTLLVVLGSLHYGYAGLYGEDFIMKLTQIFDVSLENSIPTVFSIFNLLISSMLLFVIFRDSKVRGESIAVYWLILSVIFLLLSVDEGAGLHERSHGLGLFGRWVYYGALFSLAVFLIFIPFLRRLDRRTAALFLLAGAIYVFGAVGFESFGGWKARNETDFFNLALMIFEEAFEMYGIVLFNCTLYRYLVAKDISITLTGNPQTPEP